jgi:hypothetical protein
LQREDDRGKITGEANITAEVIRPDTVWGKVLRRLFVVHARIVNTEASVHKIFGGQVLRNIESA